MFFALHMGKVSIWKICFKQECIPVGCVPPAHWPYLIVSVGRGGEHACPATHDPCHTSTHAPCHVCPPATHAPLSCMHPPAMHASLPCTHPCHAHPPAMHTPLPHMPPAMPPAMHAPPVDRQTPVKNNLRKLRLRVVKNYAFSLTLSNIVSVNVHCLQWESCPFLDCPFTLSVSVNAAMSVATSL